MNATARDRGMALLGQFSDAMTHVFDDAFGTRWAEIDDILAMAVIVGDHGATTRQLADTSGLGRRAISRMVARLCSEGLVATRPSGSDRRAVEVVLTDRGERRAAVLRDSIDDFFRESTEIAREISEGLRTTRTPHARAVSVDPIDLLQRVCEAGVSLVRAMPDAANQGQLAARQRAALVQIATQSVVRPNDLPPSLGVSRAGVAYIVDQLVAKGFVHRRRGAIPEDRRAVVLEATEEGVSAVYAVMDAIEHQRDMLSELFAEVALWRQRAIIHVSDLVRDEPQP
ncbi:MarR family winged helix-turn-helix transcriptional regulator [Microbacterium rhizomatis]|nr:MarR family transcriptional regulator [Microbacterium rhizomatis]